MSKARIIKFVPDRGRKPPKDAPGDAAHIVLPVIRIERVPPVPQPEFGTGGEETIGSLLRRMRHERGPEPKLKRATIASRRAMKELVSDAQTMEFCFRWLAQIAAKGHDPRALGELIDHWDTDQFDALHSQAEADDVLELVEQVLDTYRMKLAKEPR